MKESSFLSSSGCRDLPSVVPPPPRVSEVNACIFGEKDFLMDIFFHADSVRQYGTVEVLSQRI